jgi:hypothetical protein
LALSTEDIQTHYKWKNGKAKNFCLRLRMEAKYSNAPHCALRDDEATFLEIW